jgi:hypothetical protein
MPSYTVIQLEGILGSYVPPGSADFTSGLGQVLPRLHDIGLWRDLAYEVSLSGQYGYVSLPADTDAVLACTINNFPRMARSMWHDIRITGRQATLNSQYGVVDAGWYPVMLDMCDVQGATVAEPVTDNQLLGLVSGTAVPFTTSGFLGHIDIRVGPTEVLIQSESGNLTFTHSGEFTAITEITYNDVKYPVDLVDSAYPDKVIATVPTGSGVLRFRRFRTSAKAPDTTIHLLVKRGAPSDLTPDTVIHLGNIGAIKHGLLGIIAEDSGDLERAGFHWGMAGKLLDQELASVFGAAKPSLRIHDPAATAVHNFY